MTRKVLLHILIFAGSLLGNTYASYAQVNFQASAPAVVSVGEQFRYTLLLNSSGTGLKLPGLAGFQLVMGPSTSSSTSMQYINGQMSRTQTTTYTYIFQALSKGTFTIAPASITVEGTVVSSNSITIEVVEGEKPQTAPGTQQQQSPQTSQSTGGSDADVFIRAIVSKTNVFQGEPLVVTFKLYTRLDATNLENPKAPALNGFYLQEIEVPPLSSLEREMVNGEVYGTGVLRKVVLFPQRAGELIIDPYELDVIVRERVASAPRGFFDDFFGSAQLVRKKAVSPAIKINVKPLPQPRPQDFSGAVGNFSIEVSADKTQVKANEPVNYSIKISGTGNLKLIEQPKVDFPIGFEVFDAQVKESVRNTESGSSGSKSFEILLIPRHQGAYRIPPLNFSWFDPASGSYKSYSGEEISLQIEKADGSEGSVSVTGFAREDVRLIGEDIRFIKMNRPVFTQTNKVFFGSLPFYLAFAIPFVLLVLLVILRRKQIQYNSDLQRVRNRKASRVARRRLKKANNLLKQGKNQEFYEEILHSAWGYLGDKLNIPLAELSRNTVLEKTEGAEIIQALINELFAVIDICEAARYSPGYPGSEVEKVYSETARLIEEIENKIQEK